MLPGLRIADMGKEVLRLKSIGKTFRSNIFENRHMMA